MPILSIIVLRSGKVLLYITIGGKRSVLDVLILFSNSFLGIEIARLIWFYNIILQLHKFITNFLVVFHNLITFVYILYMCIIHMYIYLYIYMYILYIYIYIYIYTKVIRLWKTTKKSVMKISISFKFSSVMTQSLFYFLVYIYILYFLGKAYKRSFLEPEPW